MEHPENSEEYKGLTVNKGIEQPATVNPYLQFRKKARRRQFSVGEYVEGIVKGDVTVLSQAVTLVESVKPEHQAVAQEVIEKCLPYAGKSFRIGISGVPGAGKSTSIDVFGIHVLERYGGKVRAAAGHRRAGAKRKADYADAVRASWGQGENPEGGGGRNRHIPVLYFTAGKEDYPAAEDGDGAGLGGLFIPAGIRAGFT